MEFPKNHFLTFNDLNNNNNIIPGIPYYLTKKGEREGSVIYKERR